MTVAPRRALLCLAVATLAAGATACSGAETPTLPPPPTEVVAETGAPAPVGPFAADLKILVKDAAGQERTRTLTCEPIGGDLPDPAGACATLVANWPTTFRPAPLNKECPAVPGGPETATITGLIAGKQEFSSFARTNGCEVERWDALQALLGPA